MAEQPHGTEYTLQGNKHANVHRGARISRNGNSIQLRTIQLIEEIYRGDAVLADGMAQS